MKDATTLDEYFNGDKTLFLIPLYQRNYAWKRKHCERLFADLEKIIKSNIKSHFFGSIVTVRANEVENDLLIIDGQQRITTISLLILAAINSVKSGVMICENGEEYINDMRNKYLMAKYRKIDRKIKLRPIDNDIKAYDALFSGDPANYVPAEESGITSNYQLFCTLIKTSTITFEELIDAIDRLIVIDIRLDSGDNPQLIFESLNSCGKDLEEADKVRNYLLMTLSSEQQEVCYRKFWSKIEKNTDMEPTMFIRDYMTVKCKTISSITELYFDFKKFDEDNGMSRQELLEDMLKYSNFYYQASKGKTNYEQVNKKFIQLSNIGSSVCMPFYMSFLDYSAAYSLSSDEIFEVLDVIENYWARRIICGYPANVMAKSFALLHSDILRLISQHEKRGVPVSVSYAELLKFVLLKKQGNAIIPGDAYLSEQFMKRKIYHIPFDYRCFLFERMENLDNQETDDTLVSKIKNGKYTIEHIMPQTLTAGWKEALGDNWQTIYDDYLHTFANLTLTAYNSNYGNHSFLEKKEGYIDHKGNTIYGFKDSNFKLSNYLKTIDKWTKEEIEYRGQLLLKNFLHIWPMITSKYEPLEKESDIVSFDDDDVEITGRQIQSFTYRGIKHEVSTWKSMMIQVCTLVYNENPSAVTYLCTKNNWFHDTLSKERTKIAEGCFVHSSASARGLVSIINYLFAEIGIAKSNLEFDLKPVKENIVVDGDEGEAE